MKFLLLLITLNSFGWANDTIPTDTTIIDTTTRDPHFLDYQLDIAGRARFKDSVRFEGLTKFFALADLKAAFIENLKMPIWDGVLHVSETDVYSSPIYAAEIQAGTGVIYADSMGRGKTTLGFYYDDSTSTLHVPNISVDGVEPFMSLRKVNNDYYLEKSIETLLIDTTEKDILIDLTEPTEDVKVLTLKKTKGRHPYLIKGKIGNKGEVLENLKVKNYDKIQLIWDGKNWQKL